VTIEVARRLVQGGVVSAEDMEAGLLEAVTERAPLLRVLAGRMPDSARLLERELLRVGQPALETVEPDRVLCRRLPRGMCERLLAFPVGKNGASGTVDLAVADPFDPHVLEEFAHHLATPVRALQAPLGELLAQLEAFMPSSRPMNRSAPADEAFDDRTPAFGTARLPNLAAGMLPSAGRLGRPHPAGSHSAARQAPSDAPIPLVRRSFAPDLPTAESGPTGGRPEDLETVLDEMQHATSPGDVTRLLALGLETVADRVAIFSLRGRVLHGRAASAALGGNQAVARTKLDPTPGGVLAHAIEAGHYLGPVDAELGALLAKDTDELYIGRVDVSGRPALVFVLGAMTNAFLASQHADRLSRAAQKALERLLVAKKARTQDG
jgi:hypothetical protein